MDGRVVVELGVKCRDELLALSGGHDVSADGGQHFRIAVHLIYMWRANEGHRHVFPSKTFLRKEAAKLSAVGIAAHVDVHRGETVARFAVFRLGEKDEAGASAKDGQSVLDGLADGLHQLQVVEKLGLRRRFAARNNQGVFRLLPIGGLAHLKRLYVKALKHLLVFQESSLQSQYCYFHCAGNLRLVPFTFRVQP